MTNRAILTWTAALAAACGAKMTSTTLRTTPSPGQTVFDCFVEEAKARGFDVLQIDKRDLRVVVNRVDKDIQISDPTFRRAEDHLILEVPGSDGGDGTSVRVIAQSFHVHFSRRGLEYQERKASETALLAAEVLTDRCAPVSAPVEGAPGEGAVAAM